MLRFKTLLQSQRKYKEGDWDGQKEAHVPWDTQCPPAPNACHATVGQCWLFTLFQHSPSQWSLGCPYPDRTCHSDPDFQSQAPSSKRACMKDSHVFTQPSLHILFMQCTEKATQSGWLACVSSWWEPGDQNKPCSVVLSLGSTWESPGELLKNTRAESQPKPIKSELLGVRSGHCLLVFLKLHKEQSIFFLAC